MKRHKRPFDDKTSKEISLYIESNFSNELTIDKLSHKFNYSNATFKRLFHRGFGKNFSDYLLECRMNHAKKLLSENNPVSIVAAKVGYKSRTAFHSAFVTFFGQSPGSYLFDNVEDEP